MSQNNEIIILRPEVVTDLMIRLFRSFQTGSVTGFVWDEKFETDFAPYIVLDDHTTERVPDHGRLGSMFARLYNDQTTIIESLCTQVGMSLLVGPRSMGVLCEGDIDILVAGTVFDDSRGQRPTPPVFSPRWPTKVTTEQLTLQGSGSTSIRDTWCFQTEVQAWGALPSPDVDGEPILQSVRREAITVRFIPTLMINRDVVSPEKALTAARRALVNDHCRNWAAAVFERTLMPNGDVDLHLAMNVLGVRAM